MLKVAVARCAFVLLTLSMFAAGGVDKTVTNKEHGFEITFPEAWTSDASLPNAKGTSARSPVGDGANSCAHASVKGFVLREGKDPKSLVEGLLVELSKSRKNYEFVDKTESKLGDLNAFKFRVRFDEEIRTSTGPVNGRFQTISYLAVTGDRGYLITVGALKDDYDKYAKDIDAIIKSFKLIEAK